MAAGQTKEYIYISKLKNWYEAQTYCRENYKDLATITSNEEQQRLINSPLVDWSVGWIGLNKPTSTWKWSDREPTNYVHWRATQPDNIMSHECVKTFQTGWDNDFCLYTLPFFCYRNWILVKEKKTWDEAQAYCKRNYNVLASPNSAIQELVEIVAAQSETVSVWFGLRFLDGKWFWLNKDPLNNLVSLPPCPAPNYRCGALNTDTNSWENRHCNEKLNFICS